MHLFVTNEVYIIQKINKRKNSDVLNDYLKLRYSSSKKNLRNNNEKCFNIVYWSVYVFLIFRLS